MPHATAIVRTLREETIRCSACERWVKFQRVYDLNIAIWDEHDSARMRGTVTLCESCRFAFDDADAVEDAIRETLPALCACGAPKEHPLHSQCVPPDAPHAYVPA